jgi:hypothetical protein
MILRLITEIKETSKLSECQENSKKELNEIKKTLQKKKEDIEGHERRIQ